MPDALGRPARRNGGGPQGRADQACDLPFVPSLVSDPSSRRRVGHPDGAGTARPQRCQHDDGVHACVESGTAGCSESGRPASVAVEAGNGQRAGQGSVGGGSRSWPATLRSHARRHGGRHLRASMRADRRLRTSAWAAVSARRRGHLRPWWFSGCRWWSKAAAARGYVGCRDDAVMNAERDHGDAQAQAPGR
jgi:hypothetical protein